MRPTTKDLAKAAGVSLATVDRVLNARPGVRQKTVDAVNEAIEKIGFVRNISAANLARGRTYRFRFLLPERGDQFLGRLVERVVEAAAAFAAESIYVDHQQVVANDPHQMARILSDIDTSVADGVAIMAPQSPQVRDATTRLLERGVRVVQFIASQPGANPSDLVGIDNHAAGATAGRLLGRFSCGAKGMVLVIAETMTSRDSIERRLGFDDVMTRDYPHLTILPSLETYGDAARTHQIIRNSYEGHDNILGVYVLGSEARMPLESLAETSDTRRQVIIAHERTAFTEEKLRAGVLDAVIAQDPGHLVRSAIRRLRARCDEREPLASQETIRIEVLIRENLDAALT